MNRRFVAFTTAIFVIYAAVTFFVTSRMFTPTGDEPHYLVIAHSLALDGDISLLNNYRGRDYRLFYPGDLAKRTTASGDKKLEYPTFGLAMPLFLAPFYRIAFEMFPGYIVLFLRLVICFVTIAGIYQVLLFFEAHEIPEKTIFIVVGMAAVTSPLITYSSQFYPEIFAFFLIAVALRMVQSIQEKIDSNVIVLSIIPGLLLWLHPKYLILAFLIFGVTAYLLHTRPKRFQGLQALHIVLTVAGIASFFVFLQMFYGSWSPNRIYGGWQKQTNLMELIAQEGLKRIWVMFRMFFAFWIDERFGLLIYAPFYVAFFSAAIWCWKKIRQKVWPAFLFFSVHFLALCWGAPLGGYAPPTRHFVVMLPLILTALAFAYPVWTRLQRKLFLTLSGCGVLIALAMLSNYRKIFANITWRNPDGGSELWQYLHLDRWFPNLTATNLEFGLIVLWILIVCVLSVMLYPRDIIEPDERETRSTPSFE